eukprot:PhF_6_TR18878/c5_g1_i1/m.27478
MGCVPTKTETGQSVHHRKVEDFDSCQHSTSSSTATPPPQTRRKSPQQTTQHQVFLQELHHNHHHNHQIILMIPPPPSPEPGALFHVIPPDYLDRVRKQQKQYLLIRHELKTKT